MNDPVRVAIIIDYNDNVLNAVQEENLQGFDNYYKNRVFRVSKNILDGDYVDTVLKYCFRIDRYVELYCINLHDLFPTHSRASELRGWINLHNRVLTLKTGMYDAGTSLQDFIAHRNVQMNEMLAICNKWLS